MTDNARGVGEVSIALLDRVEQIWNQIFPEITFYPESDDRVLEVVRNGDKYSINGLSDGERCVLFYIGNVLLAPENSYIVVDEPETFLNGAVYNELWDLLISERPDCQFIFAHITWTLFNQELMQPIYGVINLKHLMTSIMNNWKNLKNFLYPY